MKKVLAMVLAVLMLVSVLCVGVSADEAQTAPAIVVDSATTYAGETVSVAVRTRNNPGIVGMRVALGYDPAVLTPIEQVEQDFAGATFGPLSNPLSILWVDAIHPDVTTDGVVALITFQVAEEAPVGEYPLTLSILDPDDMFNANFETVSFELVDGVITVAEQPQYIPGDVNDDGNVNVRDLGLLQQYLNGFDVIINEAAANVTGDATVNVRDMGLLQQYLNGWDVVLQGGGSVTPPDQPEPPADDDVLTVEEAIAMGSAMEHNVYTEQKYYVTGVITEVYNTMYGNMKITDDAGNILTVYGTFSADGELRYDAMEVKPVAGDTVTVYGIVGQYNGTPQIKNGWITEHIPGEGGDIGGGDDPVDPPVDPAENTLTILEAIEMGSAMAHNTYTEDKYYVTGVISEVYNDVYGNMRLIDEAGNILTIYGTYSADGELRYDAMEVKPVAGDTVTIYGIVGQYNDVPQIKNGWITAHTPGEGGDIGGGDEPVDPPVEGGATIDFTDKANRVSYSTEQQVWAQNGITVTNDKAASTSNVGDYGGDGFPARFYKSSSLLVEYTGMTKVVFNCDNYKTSYPTDLANSITAGTVTVDGYVVTVTFDAPVDSLVIETLAGQVRVLDITVYGEGGDIGGGDAPVECDHAYDNACDADCNLCGEAREVADHVYDDEYDADCNECGATREVPEKPVDPDEPGDAAVNHADLNTIVTPNANGDSKYTNSYTTESGWVTENSAIQCGGSTDMNPQFTVIGPDNTYKAVCLNGKTSAPGKISSPTLSGGISKLTITYTKMFTDTKLSATITITDLATGAVYTDVISREVDKTADKYVVWTYEWVLEAPISGDFTIEILNDCPTGQDGNKDRLTVLDIAWETTGAAGGDEPVDPEPVECEHAYDNACDADCNLCGETREVADHVYDDEYDADCNECGATREVPEKPADPDVPATGSAAIDFHDKANRVSYSTEQQVWAQNGITVTNDKAASTTNVGDYGGEGYPARFYKGSSLLVEYTGISTIVFYCDDYKTSYATDLAASITDGTVTVDGLVVTVTFDAPVDSLFIAELVAQVRVDSIAINDEGGNDPVDPEPSEPDVPVVPSEPTGDLSVEDAPVAGVAYKFGMIQGNVSATDVYYLKGGMAQTYYLDTTADVAAAIDVYLEETDGGYYLYTQDDKGTKTYINMVVSGTHVNGEYGATASTVYTFDTDSYTLIATVNDAPYWFGTRNDKTYTTVGPCKTEYEGFYCQLYV